MHAPRWCLVVFVSAAGVACHPAPSSSPETPAVHDETPDDSTPEAVVDPHAEGTSGSVVEHDEDDDESVEREGPLDCAEVATPYPGLPMASAMKGEDTGKVFGTKVRYLDEQARQAYRLEVRDGIARAPDGRPYDSGGEHTIFVFSPEGELYVSTEAAEGHFHHSSFLAGGPVTAAGEIEISNGKIVELNNLSGHYRPDDTDIDYLLCWLGEHGVDLNAVGYMSYFADPPPVPASTRVIPHAGN